MTWGWTITKFVATTALGMVSANPIGWVVGGSTSQIVKVYNEKRLNSSELTLSDKEDNLRMIELSKDYQISLALGVIGQGVGKAFLSGANEIASETAKIGKEAAKELAKNGGNWTPLARGLKELGQNLAKEETVLRAVANSTGWVGMKELFFSAIDAGIKKLTEAKNQEEFLEVTNNLLNLIQESLTGIEGEIIEHRDDLNNLRKNLLDINEKNVETYIQKGEKFSQHRQVNRRINRLLKRVKGYQMIAHDSNNCCSECRFC